MDAKPRSDAAELVNEAAQFGMVAGASVLVLLLMPMFQRPRATAGAPASRRISRAAVCIAGMDARREESCPSEPRD